MNTQTHHKLTTIWLLTLVMIMTPWLSFWATPVVAQNQQGETVILCTLNGLQQVVVQTVNQQSADNGLGIAGTLPAKTTAQDKQSCPALQLIKAFSQGLTSEPPTALPPNHPNTFAHSGHYVFHASAVFSAYRGRAPPFS